MPHAGRGGIAPHLHRILRSLELNLKKFFRD
jgi:hypothetical protein